MKTKTQIKKSATWLLILAMIITILSVDMLTAFAASDLTVTIDTGASVTLKDADGDNYYEIGTADELYAFAAAVNGGNTSIRGELTANITVNENVLDENGNLNGDGSNFRVWTPIREHGGTFDGGNHYISGLYFNNESEILVGLFVNTRAGSTVRNLGVIDSFFVGHSAVGGVVGQNYGTIENCYNIGSVTAAYDSACYIGGVAGRNYGTIENCYNTGNITGATHVGGVVGINYKTVTGCYNTGTINGVETVGGVIGMNEGGTTTDCYNTGNVTAAPNERIQYSGQSGGVVGNIVSGFNDSAVINCYNTGRISVTGSGNYNVGGVVGSGGDATITDCYNTGSVSGEEFVGGVVGHSGGSIENCYNIGTVSGIYEVSGVAYRGASVANSYYLDTCGAAGTGTAKTEAQFVSGEVAYLLGSEWGQNIGTDNCPVLGGDKVLLADGVYYNEINEFAIKSNGTNDSKATATVAIPTAGTYTLIYADYEETRLNKIDTVAFNVDKAGIITVPSEIDITLGTDDKIMLWQDMTTLVPLCEAYIVK